MFLLADNDIVFELARCDLLSEFLAWLEAPPNEVWVLRTMRFAAKKYLKDDAAAMARLQQFLGRVAETPDASSESLARFDGLDVGEHQVFAVFLDNRDNAQVITGDKRALRAVAAIAAKDPDLATALHQRVRCLESTLVGFIARFGYPVVNGKVAAGSSKNQVLRISFGANRDQAHADDALKSYFAELHAECVFICDA